MELYGTPLFSDANALSYYRLESNSNDSIGSNNGSDSNISYVSGRYGQGASFNGSSSSILLGNVLALNATDFSIVGWFKTDNKTSANPREIVGKTSTAGNEHYWRVYIDTDGTLKFGTHLDTGVGGSVSQSKTNEANTWTHFVAVNDADGNKLLYINGVLDNTGISQGQSIGTNSKNTYIGRIDNASAPYWFEGDLDDIAIFNRILTASEVAQLAQQSGNAIFFSPYLGIG